MNKLVRVQQQLCQGSKKTNQNLPSPGTLALVSKNRVPGDMSQNSATVPCATFLPSSWSALVPTTTKGTLL